MKLIEIGKGILAVTISVLVFHSIGLLPNRFWNILATLGVMVIYVKNNNDVEGERNSVFRGLSHPLEEAQ